MTDMRDPPTMAFHRAKLRADLLRPGKAEDLLDGPDAARQYLDAVEAYGTAFNAAEAEGGAPASQRLLARTASGWRGHRACCGWPVMPQPRRRSRTRHGLARAELEGLVVLPEGARSSPRAGDRGELDD